jgi:hypothetical protein
VAKLIACIDWFFDEWHAKHYRFMRCVFIAAVLLLGVVAIEIDRVFGWSPLWGTAPKNHLAAISWAVTVLLVFEVVEMVVSLRRSVADSVGRHLQVYALLLLRDAFAKLSDLPEPISISGDDYTTLAIMGTDAVGALLLFAGATWFSKLQRHRPMVQDADSADRFLAIKKLLAFGLLVTFAGLIVQDVVSVTWGLGGHRLFDNFFTILIFADVLLAIVSLGFTDNPSIVFRNFGFAFAAIVLRLAVASPEYLRPALGVAGALIAIGVTLSYNWAIDESRDGDPFDDEAIDR